MRTTLLSFFLLSMLGSDLWAAKIYGTVTDTKGEPLPFASVYIMGTTIGTTTNMEGKYELVLQRGKYNIAFQYVGFQLLQQEVDMQSKDLLIDVKLMPTAIDLTAVEIRAGEDPALRVIREAIRTRKQHRAETSKFSCEVYTKGVQKITKAPLALMGQKIGDLGGSLDSNRQGIVYLSESLCNYFVDGERQKEEMISSKVSGKDNGYSFNSASGMDFNFYDNQLKLQTPMISPIADGALAYYNYKLESFYQIEGSRTLNKIWVTPKQKHEPCFSGHIYIIENEWRIHSLDLIAEKEATRIDVIDTLRFKQLHVPVQGSQVWAMFSNNISFGINVLGIGISGNFAGIFKNYNVSPEFPKGLFSDEVVTVKKEANQRSKQYWDSIRPIPLMLEELMDYKKKDSLQIVKKSQPYMDSVDRAKNKFTFLSALGSYTWQNSSKKQYWSFGSPLANFNFNPIQGWSFGLPVTFRKEFDDIDAKWYELSASANYGTSDHQWRGTLGFKQQFNRINNANWGISGGRKVSQFNQREPINDYIASWYNLLEHQHFMILYDKYFAKANFGMEVVNGLFMSTSAEVAERNELKINTEYSTYRKDRTYQLNVPDLTGAAQPYDSIGFTGGRLATLELTLRYKPGQKFMRYPDRKFRMGSKWPEFRVTHQTGLGLTSDVRGYQRTSVGLAYDFTLGVVGESSLTMEAGTTWSKTGNLYFSEYQHFIGNQTLMAMPKHYATAFQLLPYYAYSTQQSWQQLHYSHNFGGFLFSKIPLLKKLNFQEIAGYRLLKVEGRNPYMEFSFGLDKIGWNIYRFVRVDWVINYEPGKDSRNGFVIGVDVPLR